MRRSDDEKRCRRRNRPGVLVGSSPPLGNFALRAAIEGYAVAEAALRVPEVGSATQVPAPFTLPMLTGRLLLGALASVAAGAVTTWIVRASVRPAWIVGISSRRGFIPVHVGLWDKFPLWYHLIFLVSLLPCTLLGAATAARRELRRDEAQG
jgi:hypothetical protein